MVYKVVARENAAGRLERVAKASASKASVGGAKNAARTLDGRGRATGEIVAVGTPEAVAAWTPTGRARPLHVDLVVDGEINTALTGAQGVRRAAEHHARVRAELPPDALRLSVGDPALSAKVVDLG